MVNGMIPIKIFWDDDAQVWVAIGEGIGLVLESSSYDELVQRVRIAAPEMAEANHIKCPGIVLNTQSRQVAFA